MICPPMARKPLAARTPSRSTPRPLRTCIASFYDFYVTGDVIMVELSLNGTHRGPLVLPAGTISPTGQEIHAPCCDVFHLIDGKVKSFHCYAAGTILLV
jgi:ketosteroid isomerase-like protein